MDHPRDAEATVPFCQSSTREHKPERAFSHVKPPTDWRGSWPKLRITAQTVTKKLPYPALGRVATGDRSHFHERGRAAPQMHRTTRFHSEPTHHLRHQCHRQRSAEHSHMHSDAHKRSSRSQQQIAKGPASEKRRGLQCRWISSESNLSKPQRVIHLMILVTRPEPTVRPPSRMAKPRPGSIAIGWISWTEISVVSPGMTMSVPSGRVMTPVTSVVRK